MEYFESSMNGLKLVLKSKIFIFSRFFILFVILIEKGSKRISTRHFTSHTGNIRESIDVKSRLNHHLN